MVAQPARLRTQASGLRHRGPHDESEAVDPGEFSPNALTYYIR